MQMLSLYFKSEVGHGYGICGIPCYDILNDWYKMYMLQNNTYFESYSHDNKTVKHSGVIILAIFLLLIIIIVLKFGFDCTCIKWSFYMEFYVS